MSIFDFNLGHVTVHLDPRSTCSRTVLLTLYERNVNFTIKSVDLSKKTQKTPEFVALQPFGKVPVLVDSEGSVFYESKAICKYVDAVAPGGSVLCPANPRVNYQVEKWLSIYDSYFTPPHHAIYFEKVLKARYNRGDPDQEKVDANVIALGSILDIMEKELEGQDYLAGDVFTLADVTYLSRMLILEQAGVAETLVTPRKNLSAWWERCKGRKTFQNAISHKLGDDASTPSGPAPGPPVDKIYRFKRANDGAICCGTLPADSKDDGQIPTRLEILVGDPATTPIEDMHRTGTCCDVAEILMPVEPPNVHCVGLNYLKHFEEGAKKRGVAMPVEPTMFMKPTTSVCGPLADIERPMNLTTGDEAAWNNLDFEGEVMILKDRS
jgi:glutathione S-transferase